MAEPTEPQTFDELVALFQEGFGMALASAEHAAAMASGHGCLAEHDTAQNDPQTPAT